MFARRKSQLGAHQQIELQGSPFNGTLVMMRNRFNISMLIIIFIFLVTQHNIHYAAAFIVAVPTTLKYMSSLGSEQEVGNKLSNRNKSSQLYDLSEWRDQFFEVPTEVDQVVANQSGDSYNDEPIREVCVLPFPLDDVLLQGETKELCLYEDRFHQLFERSKNFHNSVVAMGLLAPPAGILQNMPLCEIENYRVMQGKTAFGTDFSILVTIRVVGRASLLYIQDEDDDMEYLRGWCTEISDSMNKDDGGESIKVCNAIADRIDSLVSEIQTIEERLLMIGESAPDLFDSDDDTTGTSEASMRRRILEAELEEEDLSDEEMDDDEDQDMDDDDDDDDDPSDRKSRLERAFKIAKATDYQGYTLVNSSTAAARSIQDLTALSWAYFCCENDPMDVISYRLRAIETTKLSERMNLALSMMIERKTKLVRLLKKRKIDSRSDDDDLMLD